MAICLTLIMFRRFESCHPHLFYLRTRMTNLTPYLSPTLHAIDEYWRKSYQPYERKIGTLRASELGDSCDRKLWYKSQGHQEPAPEPRILRLFDRGHKEEDRVVEWLEGIGCKIWDQQKRVIYKDFFSGHIDGLILGVKEAPEKVHLFECKTTNDKGFKKLQKEGIGFQHRVQMSVYMRLLGIDRALYIAVNKNDDDLYIERYKLDPKFADAQLARAERIAKSRTPPERIGTGKPSWYECKMCKFKEVCYAD